jgi:predicted metalloprotease with PDZ domain
MLFSVALLALAGPTAPVSAPLSQIQYDISFTRETASRHQLHVTMQFTVGGPGDVLLSLPAWTPGAYEISNFSRWVSGFAPSAAGTSLSWDKLDYDTWRIRPAGARQLSVSFDYQADSLDNAMAWSREDFAFFNGTNLLLYPEGRGLSFPATVRIHTESDWQVVTGMHGSSAATGLTERNYHDLVDMPFFVGRFDLDSTTVDGLNVRLATYPAGALSGATREQFWVQYRKLFAPQIAVFGETPYTNYTTLMVFAESYPGGSALEHQSSHLGIYTPQGIGQEWVTSVTAHEMFHAFNVKRLRPAEMVPYRYDIPQPTPWLWVSEGITDYYADLTLVRAGVIDSAQFLEETAGKMGTVDNTPPTALEDASLSTWIHPTDGSGYLYYPKGSLAGFLLDILIRDASDNRQSLDQAMRQLYQTTYRQGRGFGSAEWWGAITRASGGRKFDGFNAHYIDGRDPFPWDSVLPLAGLRAVIDSAWVPRMGINTQLDSLDVRVTGLVPGGAAEVAGVQVGDVILTVGEVQISGVPGDPFEQFRAKYAGQASAEFPIRVRRAGTELTLTGKIQLRLNTTRRLDADPAAGPKAVRVRHGLFTGSTGT